MFLQNKYSMWYEALVSKRRDQSFDGYGEWHHVIPKSLGGSNKKENLVKLTAREHFIAHRFLVKMTIGDAKRRMVFALKRTCSSTKHVTNSKTYESVRELYARMLSGVPRSAETKKKISDALRGVPLSEELKQKISLGGKGKPKSEAFKQKMRERLNDPVRDAERREKIRLARSGKARSEETKKKISESRLKGR